MGFFKRIFGSEPESKPKRIHLDELEATLEERREKINRDAVEACHEEYRALMDSHSSLLEDIDWLSEETIPDRIPSAMRARVESTRKTFIRAATTALDEAPKGRPRNISELDEIRSSYLDILERFRGPTGIQRRELSAFPEVRKNILLQLRSTASTVKILDKTLAPRRDEMSLLEESESAAKELEDRLDELEAVRRDTRASKERLKQALARKRELDQRLLELKTGSRFEDLERARRELESAKERLHRIEARIRRRFSHLRRVFRKFSKKVYDNEYSLSSQGKKRLEGYIDSPMETVLAETADYPFLTEILIGVGRMVSSREIRLKERTRQKATKQIDEMLGDSLKEDLSRYSDAEQAVREAQRQVSNHELLDELSDIEESTEKEKRTIERLKDHIEGSGRKIESLSEEIRETKAFLEERLNSMFEAEVTVYGFPEPLEKTIETPSAEDNGAEGR